MQCSMWGKKKYWSSLKWRDRHPKSISFWKKLLLFLPITPFFCKIACGVCEERMLAGTHEKSTTMTTPVTNPQHVMIFRTPNNWPWGPPEMKMITDSMIPLLLQLDPGFVRESVRDFQLEQAVVAVVTIVVAAAAVAGGTSQFMRRRIFFQSMN